MWFEQTEAVGEDDPRLAHHAPLTRVSEGAGCVAAERTHDVTITTYHVPAHGWLARKAAEALWDTDNTENTLAVTPQPATRSAVLTVTGLPARMRPVIERALVVCLRSEPPAAPPGTDPVTADFFTRWTRDITLGGGYGVRCRQVVTGTSAELDALQRVVSELAAENGFHAEVEDLGAR